MALLRKGAAWCAVIIVPGTDTRSPPVNDGWSQWQPSADYSVGVEEEVMLLDPSANWSLAREVGRVLRSAPDALADQLADETQDAVIELTTDPHPGPVAAGEQARELRRALAGQLDGMDLRAAAAGTHPATLWTETRIAEGERHQQVYDTMRELARREPTFGLHVHVGVGDPERAIVLYNRLRPHLPLLLALSANSPYWQGRDSGDGLDAQRLESSRRSRW